MYAQSLTCLKAPIDISRDFSKAEKLTDNFNTPSQTQEDIPIVLFKKKEGSSTVTIIRYPSGMLKGLLEYKNSKRSILELEDLPSYLPKGNINTARQLFSNSRIVFNNSRIKVIPIFNQNIRNLYIKEEAIS